jgi:hypothetical protein
MDTKKLIGTIIGVVAFAALIAGATYAWLSVNATVNNTVFNNATSKNFTFTYSGSNTIGGFKQLTVANSTKDNITSAADATTAGDGWAAVTASKGANTPKAGIFRLKLNITTNTITTNSVVYAVCKGPCPDTALVTAISGTTATCSNDSAVVACGVVPALSNTAINLYDDTSTFNVNGAVSSTTYNIYFWLNSATIANEDLSKSFIGSISAQASQNAAGLS